MPHSNSPPLHLNWKQDTVSSALGRESILRLSSQEGLREERIFNCYPPKLTCQRKTWKRKFHLLRMACGLQRAMIYLWRLAARLRRSTLLFTCFGICVIVQFTEQLLQGHGDVLWSFLITTDIGVGGPEEEEGAHSEKATLALFQQWELWTTCDARVLLTLLMIPLLLGSGKMRRVWKLVNCLSLCFLCCR